MYGHWNRNLPLLKQLQCCVPFHNAHQLSDAMGMWHNRGMQRYCICGTSIRRKKQRLHHCLRILQPVQRLRVQ